MLWSRMLGSMIGLRIRCFTFDFFSSYDFFDDDYDSLGAWGNFFWLGFCCGLEMEVRFSSVVF